MLIVVALLINRETLPRSNRFWFDEKPWKLPKFALLVSDQIMVMRFLI